MTEYTSAHHQANPGRLAWPAFLSIIIVIYLILWMRNLGLTLINDEYSAIDYVYRVIKAGHFFPTPVKLHKPLDLLIALSYWLTRDTQTYATVVCLLCGLMIFFIYKTVSDVFDKRSAIVGALLVMFHFGTFTYSLEGNTVVTFSGLLFVGAYAAIRIKDSPRALWLYAAIFFLAGTARPDAWLFAGPLVLYAWPDLWPPRRRSLRVVAAIGIIFLAPVLWVYKDYLTNHDLMHSYHIALRDNLVGSAAGYSLFGTANFFLFRVLNNVSWPAGILALAGGALFLRERGLAGLIHPFVLFPLTVTAYLFFLVQSGLYPLDRYFYYPSLLIIIFAVHGFFRAYDWIKQKPGLWTASLPVSGALVLGLASWFCRDRWPEMSSYFSLLIASAGLLFVISMLVCVRRLIAEPIPAIISVYAVLAVFSFFTLMGIKFSEAVDGMRLESAKQTQIIEVADFLMSRIPEGRPDRILTPSRRKEQISWRFRDREIPDTLTFRETYYLMTFRRVKFLDLHPDWIVYIDGDFQAYTWGPQKTFGWLNNQDRTELYGVVINRVLATPLIRVFQVTYPAGWPEKQPVPSIPEKNNRH